MELGLLEPHADRIMDACTSHLCEAQTEKDYGLDADLILMLWKVDRLHCTEELADGGVYSIADVISKGWDGLMAMGMKKPDAGRIAIACTKHAEEQQAVAAEQSEGPGESEDCVCDKEQVY